MFLSSVAFVTVLFVTCCSSEEQQANFDLGENKLSLKSEKGYVLASNSEVIFGTVSTIIEKKYNKKDVRKGLTVNEISYVEEDNFSFAVLDVKSQGEKYSVFVPLYINDNYIMLRDNKGIKFAKIEPSDHKAVIKGDVLYFEKKSPLYGLNNGGWGAAVCQGDCCGWTTVIAGQEYNCGCTGTEPAVIITTSDGCKVDLL